MDLCSIGSETTYCFSLYITGFRMLVHDLQENNMKRILTVLTGACWQLMAWYITSGLDKFWVLDHCGAYIMFRGT